MCSAHHHLVHEGGWTVTGDGHGGFTFHNPDGELLHHVPTPAGGTPEAVKGMHDATIDDRTTIPTWYGEPLDLHHVVEALIHHEKRAAETLSDVSAETSQPQRPDLN